MKKRECKHCGKETSRAYTEYYNPRAGLWSVTTCSECREIDSVEDVQSGFSNLATRHGWYIHLLRIACVVIFLICLAGAYDYSLDGRWRVTLGIVAALTPGLYGGLRGVPAQRITATNKGELEGMIRKESGLDEGS